MTLQESAIPLAVTRWSGRALIAVAVLAVLWPPTVEWGGRRWGWPVVAVTGLVVVAAAALWIRAVYRPERRRVRAVPAAVGGGATVVGMVVAALVLRVAGFAVTADSILDAVVLAIVAGTVLGLGWTLVATVEDPPDPEPTEPTESAESAESVESDGDRTVPRLPLGLPGVSTYDDGSTLSRTLVVAAVVATVVTLLVAAPMADRDTARPLDGLAVRAPRDLGGDHTSFAAAGRVSGGGRHLVVDVDGGVEVRDAVTGRPRWHYRDPRNTFSAALVSADHRTVVVFRPDRDRPSALAFDVATGVRRWSRRLPTEKPVDSGSLPLVTVAIGRLLVLFDDDRRTSGSSGFAIDVGSGDVRWRVPDPPDPACTFDDATAATDTVVVTYRCDSGSGGSWWQVVSGLSAADGRIRWTQRSPDRSSAQAVQVSAREVHVHQLLKAASCETVVLDADSGTERARYADPTLGCASPIVGNGVTVYTTGLGIAGVAGDQVLGVDQRTGQVRWAARLPTGPASTVMAGLIVGTSVYLVVRTAPAATEVTLAALDLATGALDSRQLPLPVRGDPTRRRFQLLPAPGRLVLVSGGPTSGAGDDRTVTIVG